MIVSGVKGARILHYQRIQVGRRSELLKLRLIPLSTQNHQLGELTMAYIAGDFDITFSNVDLPQKVGAAVHPATIVRGKGRPAFQLTVDQDLAGG